MSELERKPEVLASTRDEAVCPCTDWRGVPRGPLQLEWRLDFPEATRAGLRSRRNSRGTPSFMLQLEKPQEILPSTQDEAPFHCSILREFPSSLLSLKRVLDTL